MHQAGLNKDWPTIIKLQEMAAPLERLRLAHDDASMVKTGMDLVGLAGGKVRPPRRDVPPQARDAIGEVLKRLHVARLR
jgi:dihydrodipicolinate synthase/N-acetylneuraminate lyase